VSRTNGRIEATRDGRQSFAGCWRTERRAIEIGRLRIGYGIDPEYYKINSPGSNGPSFLGGHTAIEWGIRKRDRVTDEENIPGQKERNCRCSGISGKQLNDPTQWRPYYREKKEGAHLIRVKMNFTGSLHNQSLGRAYPAAQRLAVQSCQTTGKGLTAVSLGLRITPRRSRHRESR